MRIVRGAVVMVLLVASLVGVSGCSNPVTSGMADQMEAWLSQQQESYVEVTWERSDMAYETPVLSSTISVQLTAASREDAETFASDFRSAGSRYGTADTRYSAMLTWPVDGGTASLMYEPTHDDYAGAWQLADRPLPDGVRARIVGSTECPNHGLGGEEIHRRYVAVVTLVADDPITVATSGGLAAEAGGQEVLVRDTCEQTIGVATPEEVAARGETLLAARRDRVEPIEYSAWSWEYPHASAAAAGATWLGRTELRVASLGEAHIELFTGEFYPAIAATVEALAATPEVAWLVVRRDRSTVVLRAPDCDPTPELQALVAQLPHPEALTCR